MKRGEIKTKETQRRECYVKKGSDKKENKEMGKGKEQKGKGCENGGKERKCVRKRG